MITKKTNKIFIKINKEPLGEYIDTAGTRYCLNTATQINAPDDSDLSMWEEHDSIEQYLPQNGLKYDPLTEEETRRIMRARE